MSKPKPLSIGNKRRALFIFLVLNGVVIYYLSPLSIYYFSPALQFVMHIFFFPFYIVPQRFYLSCGGFILLCLPNPLTIIPAYIISLIFSISLVNLTIKGLSKITPKFIGGVGLISVIIFLVLGSYTERQTCINNFKKHPPYGQGNYIEKTGIIQFVFSGRPDVKQANIFYKVNGLDYISGDIGQSAIYARVPVGQEFAKICQIKSYPQIYEGSAPPTHADLMESNPLEDTYWKSMDKNFCNTGQIDYATCVRLYKKHHDR